MEIQKNSSKIKVKPRSRKDIRNVAETLKEKWGLKGKKINILKFLEIYVSLLEYEYEIVEDSELKTNYAEFDPLDKIMRIRESVYIGASEGNTRDRFTIAHEIGHMILHSLMDAEIKFCRLDEIIKPYEDIEWQANTFAAEFLVDAEETKNLTVEEISEKYGVSKTVAAIQKKNCWYYKKIVYQTAIWKTIINLVK